MVYFGMTIREQLDDIAEQRILVLDGATGSLIQKHRLEEADYRGAEFSSHPAPLFGCTDLLCLSRPELISSIHEAYLAAGADIISACSFNASAVSLADYGLADRSYDISRAAAELARKAADAYSSASKPRFAAGSMGPTPKTLSISPDIDDPGKRNIVWDQMEGSYYDNARGLVDGGVDMLLLETVFDTLNAKAALFAIARLLEEKKLDIPVIISATVSDASGRLLAGQTIDAFAVSVLHAQPWALGLNCSLGAEKMLPFFEELAAVTPVLTSCYPNAGLPDKFGVYRESPGETAAFMRPFFEKGLVNIAGGCCGTTAEHTAELVRLAGTFKPRKKPGGNRLRACLSGLEVLDIDRGFVDIGERTNVAGSRKFLRLVREGAWEQALDIARDMSDRGAGIIDVCMDDALLDAKESMIRFLALCACDPGIAARPVMIDSSSWDVLEAGLKMIQGKGIVNSISLKEGEDEFLRRAHLARRYGAAVVVMLFDEKGQAASFERRIETARRSYRLLCGAGYPPSDIIFDPNVLSIATGINSHDRYALDFIRACAWIREHCPGVHISAGVSNLSFSFRGSETVRRAIHAVFLKYASEAGLSMAIVNPAGFLSYDEVSPELREAAEDAVLCRGENPPEKLIALAARLQEDRPDAAGPRLHWREAAAEERIQYALLQGVDAFIEQDLLEMKKEKSALELLEGPLMQGMGEVGKRFGEGRMFLPQVIRSARVMKKAAAVLAPFMEKEKSSSEAGRVVLATVKGDVHDIGKNIAGVVMGCNGYSVIDLGVMVPCEKILEAAEKEHADFIGLSGLIAPSLEEMVKAAGEMERRRFSVPLLIGGAAASAAHTALRIAPAYSGPVVYIRDAGEIPAVLHALLSPEKPRFLKELDAAHEKERERHYAMAEKRRFLSLEEARNNRVATDWGKFFLPEPKISGAVYYGDYPLERVIPRINWEELYRFWDSEASRPERAKLRGDAQKALLTISEHRILRLGGAAGFFPAFSSGDDVVILNQDGKESGRFCFLRNQEAKAAGVPSYCLADYIPPEGRGGRIGLFALSSGFGLEEAVFAYRDRGDDYTAMILTSLADRLAEAFAEELQEKAAAELWGLPPGGYKIIRPAFGYPACPDHHDKETCLAVLDPEKKTGLRLSESAMIIPAQSLCGMYFVHPAAVYFGTGKTADDQLADWARRKGISVEEGRRRTGRI
ncbi:MAG: methionine synthase [Treponema sp.]|jgi:5-methyltetrahydrofolate--homocysteine methyltransferase|nr:methionine synthase [Treponema sp.]